MLYAQVKTFSGKIVTIEVEQVWYFNGKPEKVRGEGYKFDQTEEPFILKGVGTMVPTP